MPNPPRNNYTDIVIGAGFFGMYLAKHLGATGKIVLLVESAEGPMRRASLNNQARVHNGYHYPRSVFTAYRSHVNFGRFCAEFEPAIDSTFRKLYGVAKYSSKVTARQYARYFDAIGAPVHAATAQDWALFNPRLIDGLFVVEEYAFDADVLRSLMESQISEQVDSIYSHAVANVVHDRRLGMLRTRIRSLSNNGIEIEVMSNRVWNVTYSGINRINRGSGLPEIGLKHEVTEMCLIERLPPLEKKAITLMCGPFFSLMPWPPAALDVLSHVRYTPHVSWHDGRSASIDPDAALRVPRPSSFDHMRHDVSRYVPLLRDARRVRSIWEIKTTLPRNEMDDGRPILFKANYNQCPGLFVVMGGKIDNIYDMIQEVDKWVPR